jgi:hypothetical protein
MGSASEIRAAGGLSWVVKRVWEKNGLRMMYVFILHLLEQNLCTSDFQSSDSILDAKI